MNANFQQQYHIGERIGSLMRQSEHQSKRSDAHDKRLEEQDKRLVRVETTIHIARRILIVASLWALGAITTVTSPEIGKSLAPVLKDILTHWLTRS